MNAGIENLVDDKNRVVLLFTPLLAKSARNPGYITYPSGAGENGGRHTYAAARAVMVPAETNRGNDARHCVDMLNLVNDARDRDQADIYRVEPCVVAADIYGEGQLTG